MNWSHMGCLFQGQRMGKFIRGHLEGSHRTLEREGRHIGAVRLLIGQDIVCCIRCLEGHLGMTVYSL